MGIWGRLAFLLLLLLLLRGLGQSSWPAAVALALRWLLGDSACCGLLVLAVLAWPWLGPWMPHWLSLAAAALTLALLPTQPPPGLRWLPADLAYIFKVLRLGLNIQVRLSRQPPDTFVDSFERRVRAQPGRAIDPYLTPQTTLHTSTAPVTSSRPPTSRSIPNATARGSLFRPNSSGPSFAQSSPGNSSNGPTPHVPLPLPQAPFTVFFHPAPKGFQIRARATGAETCASIRRD